MQCHGLKERTLANASCADESNVCFGILKVAAGTRGESRLGHTMAAFSTGIRNGSVWSWMQMSNSTSCLASVATIASRK